MTDLDDRTNCPLAAACAVCGSSADLAVATAETAVGVNCLTLCADCEDDGHLPAIPSMPAAFDLVNAHCEHLGITLDQMAELMKAGRLH